MKERPIIFNGDMVRAILDGRKIQTRRVIRPQPSEIDDERRKKSVLSDCYKKYGKPGDRLWVRETFCYDWCDHTIYKADGGSAIEAGYSREPKWRPSIYMSRRASRINLEIKNVRVERLQDITYIDITREGFYDENLSRFSIEDEGKIWFKSLWDSINAKRGFDWNINPWVCVITFKQLNENE